LSSELMAGNFALLLWLTLWQRFDRWQLCQTSAVEMTLPTGPRLPDIASIQDRVTRWNVRDRVMVTATDASHHRHWWSVDDLARIVSTYWSGNPIHILSYILPGEWRNHRSIS
jgi:hypothetical protein